MPEITAATIPGTENLIADRPTQFMKSRRASEPTCAQITLLQQAPCQLQP